MNDIQPITLPGIDPRRPLVIAGPCSAETEEQVLDTARSLAAEGIRICRAGLWKPRTKPGGFEGVGEAGIAWLQRVKRETGMYTSTEVATREHVATALKGGVDLLWIGARTAANPFAMQEIADALRGTDVPVLVKNPVSPDLELWIGAGATLNPANLIDSSRFEVKTADATISLDPEHSYLVETRIIDGRKYLLIPADEDIEVNGFGVRVKGE